MLSLWEDLLILRAKWEERLKHPPGIFSPADLALKEFYSELDKIIKDHTRVKVPLA